MEVGLQKLVNVIVQDQTQQYVISTVASAHVRITWLEGGATHALGVILGLVQMAAQVIDNS